MAWDKNGNRYLAKLTEKQAQEKLLKLITQYKGKSLSYFMKRYSPLNENSINHHVCVAKNAGISLNEII